MLNILTIRQPRGRKKMFEKHRLLILWTILATDLGLITCWHDRFEQCCLQGLRQNVLVPVQIGYRVHSQASPLLTPCTTRQAQQILLSLYLGRFPWRKALPKTHPSQPLPEQRQSQGVALRCWFLPLNLDLTIQTKHPWLLTVESGKEWNVDHGFVFKIKSHQESRLYSDSHHGIVYNSKD